uniref:Uncharacterized protein n=1 Tax=Setaria italica TaxID=4555 RepID=K3Y2J7_SETIT
MISHTVLSHDHTGSRLTQGCAAGHVCMPRQLVGPLLASGAYLFDQPLTGHTDITLTCGTTRGCHVTNLKPNTCSNGFLKY